MYSVIRVCYPATDLGLERFGVSKRKLGWILVSPLLLHPGVIQTPTIDSWWCSGFHPARLKPKKYKLLGQSSRCFLSRSSTAEILITDVDFSVKKCAISQNDGF
jgi:hypothetical protein